MILADFYTWAQRGVTDVALAARHPTVDFPQLSGILQRYPEAWVRTAVGEPEEATAEDVRQLFGEPEESELASQESEGERKGVYSAPTRKQHAPPAAAAAADTVEAGASPVGLGKWPVRTVKTVFAFEREDRGDFIYYSEKDNNRSGKTRGIRLDRTTLARLLRGHPVRLSFRKYGEATYFIDFESIARHDEEARVREEQRRSEATSAEQEWLRKVLWARHAEAVISDHDMVLSLYVDSLEKAAEREGYNPRREALVAQGKLFLAAVRERNIGPILDTLTNTSNAASRAFFSKVTGETLPTTQKATRAFLLSWGRAQPELDLGGLEPTELILEYSVPGSPFIRTQSSKHVSRIEAVTHAHVLLAQVASQGYEPVTISIQNPLNRSTHRRYVMDPEGAWREQVKRDVYGEPLFPPESSWTPPKPVEAAEPSEGLIEALARAAADLSFWRGSGEVDVFRANIGPNVKGPAWAVHGAGVVRQSAWEALQEDVQRAAPGGQLSPAWERILKGRLQQGIAAVYARRALDLAEVIRERASVLPADRWQPEARSFQLGVWEEAKPRFPDASTTLGGIEAALAALQVPAQVELDGGAPDLPVGKLAARFGYQPKSEEETLLERYGPADSRPADDKSAYFVTARRGKDARALLGPFETHLEAILAIPEAKRRMEAENADPFSEAGVGTAYAPRGVSTRWGSPELPEPPALPEALRPLAEGLVAYGATLTSEGFIQTGDKVMRVRVVVKKGRARAESATGQLLASGPPTAKFIQDFVEKFWFWERR